MPVTPNEATCANCGAAVGVTARGGRGFSSEPKKAGGGSKAGLLIVSAVMLGGAGFGAFQALSDAEEPATQTDTSLVAERSPVAPNKTDKPDVTPFRPDTPTPRTATAPPADTEQPTETEQPVPSEEEAAAGSATDQARSERPASDEKQTLQLLASVVSARGRSLKKGSSCLVNVHLTGPKITDLDVACGTETLYDTRTPLNGMSSRGSGLYESPAAKPGQWQYGVGFTDTGSRSSRNQITLDSGLKQATVFSESVDSFRVELRVAEHTAPREGEPLFDTPREVDDLAKLVTPGAVEGEVEIPKGKCTLTSRFVSASSGGLRCKTSLSCGRTVLYGTGTSGYGPCTVEGQSIVGFSDPKHTFEDGDPSLILDLAQRQLTLADSPSQQAYTMNFSLDE